MPVKILWTPAARAGLTTIYKNIAREQPRAADRYAARLREKIMSLAEQPRLGQRHEEIAPSARMLVEAPYVVLYEMHPDTDEGPVDAVEIVHIVDGRRDLRSLY